MLWSIELLPDPLSSLTVIDDDVKDKDNVNDQTKTHKKKEDFTNIIESAVTSNNSSSSQSTTTTVLVHASTSISNVLQPPQLAEAVLAGGRSARVALADWMARQVQRQQQQQQQHIQLGSHSKLAIQLEPLDRKTATPTTATTTTTTTTTTRRQRPTSKRSKKSNSTTVQSPYVVERSDVWTTTSTTKEIILHVLLRMTVIRLEDDEAMLPNNETNQDENLEEKKSDTDTCTDQDNKDNLSTRLKTIAQDYCSNLFAASNHNNQNHNHNINNNNHTALTTMTSMMEQVASVVLQDLLRDQLTSNDAVAFICNGSILPRASGRSLAPMASPPAIPFVAPLDSPMNQHLEVTLPTSLAHFLPAHLPKDYSSSSTSSAANSTTTTIRLQGLIIPAGITLICGGGYHGKSTLLQAISHGITNKIPGDGREYCVSQKSAVSVRAEDGRYVNNCNISAFISNLPTPPGVTAKPTATQHFSTKDSSGSTSQASNVAEAIELGASALLIDEDLSASNFMARDGRMRALVMDESITPLLYRVNGLYAKHKISSVVVVGGVGDWLDIPHQVVLLDKYVASDATKKAASISYQFSYNHVQYGGKGVVHRLEWEATGTPAPRRPSDAFCRQFSSESILSEIRLLEGGQGLALHRRRSNHLLDDDDDDDDDDEEMQADEDEEFGSIDASKLEQLLATSNSPTNSKRPQLFACGLCVLWILKEALKHPNLGIKDLLQRLDQRLDGSTTNGDDDDDDDAWGSGLYRICQDLHPDHWRQVLDQVGVAHRPRSFEVGQALTRLFGITMEHLPVPEEEEDRKAREEAERKKEALQALWANRRSNN